MVTNKTIPETGKKSIPDLSYSGSINSTDFCQWSKLIKLVLPKIGKDRLLSQCVIDNAQTIHYGIGRLCIFLLLLYLQRFCSCWVARLLLGNASHFLVRSDELHRCDHFPSLSNPQYQLVWSSWECLSTELCLRLYIWEKLSKRKSRCLSLHEHFQWILLRLAPIQFSIFPIWISCASIVPLVCFLHPMVVSTVEALVDNASVASH